MKKVLIFGSILLIMIVAVAMVGFAGSSDDAKPTRTATVQKSDSNAHSECKGDCSKAVTSHVCACKTSTTEETQHACSGQCQGHEEKEAHACNGECKTHGNGEEHACSGDCKSQENGEEHACNGQCSQGHAEGHECKGHEAGQCKKMGDK